MICSKCSFFEERHSTGGIIYYCAIYDISAYYCNREDMKLWFEMISKCPIAKKLIEEIIKNEEYRRDKNGRQ